jgi:hypothetical protein
LKSTRLSFYGGTFQVRKLDASNDLSELVIPASEQKFVDKIEKGQEQKVLHIPNSKTYVAVAWMPGIGVFQITVSKKHDIARSDALKKDMKLVKKNKFYWLLPASTYHSFKAQTPVSIPQYAVLIPYPSTLGIY